MNEYYILLLLLFLFLFLFCIHGNHGNVNASNVNASNVNASNPNVHCLHKQRNHDATVEGRARDDDVHRTRGILQTQ
jgi:hypothetical protein